MNKVLWRGIGKVIEEAGEVLQLCGKLIAFPAESHPDGTRDMRIRLTEELGDLYAALDYFAEANELSFQSIDFRRTRKMEMFRDWTLSGLIPEEKP